MLSSKSNELMAGKQSGGRHLKKLVSLSESDVACFLCLQCVDVTGSCGAVVH